MIFLELVKPPSVENRWTEISQTTDCHWNSTYILIVMSYFLEYMLFIVAFKMNYTKKKKKRKM